MKLPRPIGRKRRDVLSFLGGTVAVSLFGCLRKQSAFGEPTAAQSQQSQNQFQTNAATPACVVKPQQTEGPYFVDERLDRADIRSDSATGAVKPGVPLQLAFQVSQIGGQTCTPLAGATIDIWHCDAQGVYSDVEDRSFNTIGQKFLRGYQITNAEGIAEFITIYPGWYPGRTVHIHFKIRVGETSAYEFTSQLYFDDALTDRVYTQSPYAERGQRTQTNETDRIFQDGGDQLTVQLTSDGNGYRGRFAIGLQMS